VRKLLDGTLWMWNAKSETPELVANGVQAIRELLLLKGDPFMLSYSPSKSGNNLVMFTANGPATFYTVTSDILLDLQEEAESPLYPSMRPNDYGLKRCDEGKVHISYGCLSLSE
jgi:hypothetical protein